MASREKELQELLNQQREVLFLARSNSNVYKFPSTQRVHPLVNVKFEDFSRTFKAFLSKFKDLELGKIFENGTDLP
jgi:alpha-N-acetylglucosamine transferase